MKYVVVLCLMLLASLVEARELSLEQALRLAEQHSHSLKQAQAELDAANETLAATKAGRMPTLSLDARAGYISDIASLEFELPGLPTLSRDFGSNETYQADLRLSLPIYTGGRLGSAIKMAESNRQLRAASTEIDRDRLYLQVRLDYLGLQRALSMIEAARASLQRTTIIQNDLKASFAAGAADSINLLDARLAHTKAEFRLRQTEINARTYEVRLLARLGLSYSEELRLTDTLPDPTAALAKLTDQINRPELTAAGALVSLKVAGVESERAGWRPTLAVYSGYSYGKPNNDPFSDDWNDYFSLGANLNWSLNLGRQVSRRTASASFALDAARNYKKQVSETISREAELAFEQLKLAHYQYLSSHLENQISLQNYGLANAAHEAGNLPANRLLEIETSLTVAQAALAAARVDFYIAQSAYYYATGDKKLGKGL